MFCMAPRGCSICWEKSIGCVVVVSFAPPISVSCFCLLLVIPPICFLSLYLFIFGQCLTRLTQSCTSSVTSNGEETLVSELKRPSWLSGVSVNFVGGGVQSGCSWAWSPSMTFSLYKSKSILGSSKQCWCALIKHVCVCVCHIAIQVLFISRSKIRCIIQLCVPRSIQSTQPLVLQKVRECSQDLDKGCIKRHNVGLYIDWTKPCPHVSLRHSQRAVWLAYP